MVLGGGIRYYARWLKSVRLGGKEYACWACLKPEQYEAELKQWFEMGTGEMLNLENPVTYNQKIQWLKLRGGLADYARFADKIQVRDWVREKVGEPYLTPIYGVWNTFDEIDFDKLPDRFALKTNHGAGWNIIVTDKSRLDMADARKKINRWLKLNYAYYIGGLERQYESIPPKVFAEEYLENADNDLYDYKFFCFNGKVEYIMFIRDRFTGSGIKKLFYDRDWNWQPITYEGELIKLEVEPPKQLHEMIEVAEKLAAGFPAVRVDLYALPDGSIRFGEYTFTSFSGAQKWVPPESNRTLGDLFTLPETQGGNRIITTKGKQNAGNKCDRAGLQS